MKPLFSLLISISCLNGFSQKVPVKTIESAVKIITLDNNLIPFETQNRIRSINSYAFYDTDETNRKLMVIKGVSGNCEYALTLADNKIKGIINALSDDSLIRTVYIVNIPATLWCCTPGSPGHKKHSCTMDKIKETTKKENCTDWAPCN